MSENTTLDLVRAQLLNSPFVQPEDVVAKQPKEDDPVRPFSVYSPGWNRPPNRYGFYD